MKLSKLFHTLYATVMALPVLIIPIFALNILHKETEPISIEVQENKKQNFNQRFRFNENATIYDYVNSYTVEFDNVSLNAYANIINNATTNSEDKYLLTYEFMNSGDSTLYSYFDYNNVSNNFYQYQNNQLVQMIVSFTERAFALNTNRSGTLNGTLKYNLFDLTAMYGTNIPTIAQFNLEFPNYFYDYVLEKEVLIEDVTTTYNDTDIGSQFVYALYKPVHDYFNFGDFFGLGGMYDWFQLNIFNGTAPLSFFIVFNVMIYWLFISLFWLLFDILIYVPMVIHKWLDKAEM